MKCVVLNYSPYGNPPDIKSNNLLVKAATALGHESSVVSMVEFNLSTHPIADDSAASILLLPRYDIRCAEDLDLVLSLVQRHALQRIPVSPSWKSILLAEHKLLCSTALKFAGVPVPRQQPVTPFFRDTETLRASVEALGGFPLLIKSPYGWGGMGVARVDSFESLSSVLDLAFQTGEKRLLLLEEFFPPGRSKSLLVAGGKVMKGYERSPAPGEFRSNIRVGGREEIKRVSLEENELAKATLDALGLLSGSIDIVERERGAVVIEVNSSPGLDPEKDQDVAQEMILAAGGLLV